MNRIRHLFAFWVDSPVFRLISARETPATDSRRLSPAGDPLFDRAGGPHLQGVLLGFSEGQSHDRSLSHDGLLISETDMSYYLRITALVFDILYLCSFTKKVNIT